MCLIHFWKYYKKEVNYYDYFTKLSKNSLFSDLIKQYGHEDDFKRSKYPTLIRYRKCRFCENRQVKTPFDGWHKYEPSTEEKREDTINMLLKT